MIKNIFSHKYINKYKQKLKYIGPKNKIKLENFLLSRLFISIILLAICLIIPKYGLYIAIVCVPIFYFSYTNILIDSKIRYRNEILYNEAIVFFEMLYLCIKQTNDLKTSLDMVTNKLGNSLSLEFKKILENNKYNNDLNEVFKRVIDSIPNYDVRNALVDLKESEDYLTTIDEIIKQLQDKNLLITKNKSIYKPIVISFMSLIFIFIICYLLFNANDIVSYFDSLFTK